MSKVQKVAIGLSKTNRYLVIFGMTVGIVEPSHGTLNNPSLYELENFIGKFRIGICAEEKLYFIGYKVVTVF